MNIKDAFAKSLEIKYIGPDSTIVSQNSAITGLYYVIDGSLKFTTALQMFLLLIDTSIQLSLVGLLDI